MSDESHETRLKRLKMRSWRRGTKEMDLILGSFADHGLTALAASDLDIYEKLLDQNDHDLYGWFSVQIVTPPEFMALVGKISTDLPTF